MNSWQGGVMASVGVAAGATAATAAGALAWRAWRKRREENLEGRAVLITGGSRGLGFALAREFLAQGARVAICARDAAEVESARKKLAAEAGEEPGRVFARVADLRREDDARELIAATQARFGFLDVLVNNAGVMQVGPWEQMTDADYQEALDVHVWAPLRLSRLVLPKMIARGRGRIVNIASIGGVVPVPHMLPYTLSKFALVGMSEALRAEVYRHGVRVTVICPWLTRTGSQEGAKFKGHYDREFAWFAAAGASPLIAQSPEAAARRVVLATRRGEARVVLGLPGKLAALLHGVAPGLTANLMAQANRLLPRPDAAGQEPRAGRDSYNRLTERLLRPRIRRDKAKYNQGAA